MNNIFVTEPSLPPLEEFIPYLEDIWNRKWLTNNGYYHQELEKALSEYLGVKHVCLFSNGTLALITALQALRITGEVITTPYSFVATTHSLWWNGIEPVFVDIEPDYLNIDPNKIESAITTRTTAIMPVHVYGNPCYVEKIKDIADTYGLRVIYDAAHAFGVKSKGESVLNFGNLSILSFHATKVYNTIEGGAIICHDEKMKKRIDYLKNFGFEDETTVVAPGINAKMNEVQAAYGILQLKHIDSYIQKREKIASLYKKGLRDIQGITFLNHADDCQSTYSYFPILIDEKKYQKSRDEVYELFKQYNIYTRRYFYPLISNFPTYSGLLSSNKENLPVATKVSNEVLCLPIYSELKEIVVERIIDLLKHKFSKLK